MAKKNDSLIGFDPLAWMEEESGQVDDSIDKGKAQDETSLETKVENSQNIPAVMDSEAEKVTKEIEVEVDSLVEPELLQTEGSSNEIQFTLDATLNIQNVGRLHEQVLKLLENQNKIEIDASSVVVIDTATLQLLVILKKTAIELHKEVTIDFPSDNFIESAKLLGLSEILEVDQAAAGFF